MSEPEQHAASHAQYDEMAAEYAAAAETNAFNALYERPATLSLLPSLAGKRVLDAGCGPGWYAAELVRRGASVIGIDASEHLLEIARRRSPDNAEFHVADLSEPMPFVPSASIDLVL